MSTTLKTQLRRQRISNNFNVLTISPKVVLMQLNRFMKNALIYINFYISTCIYIFKFTFTFLFCLY